MPAIGKSLDRMGGVKPTSAIIQALKKGRSAAINVLGDSTGNETTEWVYRAAQMIAAQIPSVRVQHKLWNDAGSASIYDPWTVIQAASGERGIYFDGTGGVILPYADIGSITSDFQIVAKIKPDLWLDATREQTICSKFLTAGNRCFRFYISQTGTLVFEYSVDGTTLVSIQTSATGFTAGTTKYVRTSFDQDNGAGKIAVYIDVSDDGVTWSNLASNTAATAAALFNAAIDYEIGSRGGAGGGSFFKGTIYQAEIRSGEKSNPSYIISPQPIEAWTRRAAYSSPVLVGSPTLYVVNGSRSGADLAYLTNATRFPRMAEPYIQPLYILSCSLNDGYDSGSVWLAKWDAWRTQILARCPTAIIAVLTQNPVSSGYPAYQPEHERRITDLSRWAMLNDVEVIDTYSELVDASGVILPDYIGDGTHMSLTGREAQAQYVGQRFLSHI